MSPKDYHDVKSRQADYFRGEFRKCRSHYNKNRYLFMVLYPPNTHVLDLADKCGL